MTAEDTGSLATSTLSDNRPHAQAQPAELLEMRIGIADSPVTQERSFP